MVGDDAKILTIGIHEDVATAQMDVIGSHSSLHNQELVRERTAVADLQLRQQPTEDFATNLGGGGEFAKGIAFPIVAVPLCLRAFPLTEACLIASVNF
jgi:hypothetical protein